jgi:hypothetical protein
VLTGIDLIDEFNGKLAIANNRDFAVNIMLFERFANQLHVGPVIFDQNDLRLWGGRLRFSGFQRQGG